MNEPMAPEVNVERPAPLDVSVKITPVTKDGNLLAFANVTLGGCFAVTGIRVMDSENCRFGGSYGISGTKTVPQNCRFFNSSPEWNFQKLN